MSEFSLYIREFISKVKSGQKLGTSDNNVLKALIVSTGQDDEYTQSKDVDESRTMTEEGRSLSSLASVNFIMLSSALSRNCGQRIHSAVGWS